MVKMPQRQRHNTGGGAGGAELPLLDPGVIEAHNAVTTTRCCVPLACGCLRGYEPINLDSPTGCVRVHCNNEHCTLGNLMHGECFSAWEAHVLAFLRSCGRARSWSEKQRLQNLWTKRGYDLAYRACSCLCSRGHLRKDLDWTPPTESDDENRTRKKKKNRQNQKPTLVTVGTGAAVNNNNPITNNNNTVITTLNSTPAGDVLGQPCQRHRNNSISSTGSSPPSDAPTSPHHAALGKRRSRDFFSDRSRHGSGGGLFARRPDFSSFNALPRHKINSYHIKMEDDGLHGNDDTRCFILSTLAAQRTSRTACVLCHQALLVFDRYPLLDGTFFLTPIQHAKSAIPVHVEGRQQYLAAVCMGCLEGWSVSLRCAFCSARWNGSALILGTMYSFDIFAAMPCCESRLKCSKCEAVVIPPDQRLSFFSDYSRTHACPSCGHVDHHFVKPLSSFIRDDRQSW
ncbi:headcase protein-like [Homarus americanus]|uniref:headcase protein-like n=1 Tax=Homarus americanus TaxID=6706 RepID=UPI001C46C435|nr:headcase protein-like [Homarus americanus]XP_042210810.1 headcase protein-like [Homarus americanus]